jgi:hypothetical protein
MKVQLKKAILLTGASARISQEVAIIDQLIKQKGLKIDPSDTLLTGFSSGSLNMIAINGLINKPEWDSYYKSQLLFNLKTEDVYRKNGKLPYNTEPLRGLVNSFLKNINISILKDLPFTSNILAFQRKWFWSKTRWARSDYNMHWNLEMTDLMMASTAIPIIFPKQSVFCKEGCSSNFPNGKKNHYNDGGTGGTFEGFGQNLGEYVKKYGMFDEMYIISPMREADTVEFNDEVKKMKNSVELELHKNIQEFLGSILQKTFVKFLKKLDAWKYQGNPMAKSIYVCVPELEKNFPILSFDQQKEQYVAVTNWAEKNPGSLTITLKEYLKMYAI